jgi:hypothetical protein
MVPPSIHQDGKPFHIQSARHNQDARLPEAEQEG